MIKRAWSRAAALAGGTAAVLAMTAVTAAPAQAAYWGNWHILAYSDQCLDGSVSQGVRLNSCNGGSHQTWTKFGGYYGQIKHYQSGKCLDGSVSQGVRLKNCNGGSYQQWYPADNGDIVHYQSGKCLDGSVSQGVRLKDCNLGVYQGWW
ncbi:RICIN domain-containing protein [Streptomyces aidingensis]|uniref:Alpha-galactosidase n=1 Tax=Streptomyces aidingensis TaxID=910347 RepID=A0A1I1LC35_9ACTN|nr:ricin-type beta-trefoil lectin domain protein [Streptomyces aidingensis]SFC70515.1 alpha-galactosidase [Streptomyces aidingensis]